MKVILVLLCILLLQACSTTNPGAAAGISYRLPRTDAKATLGIDVLKCNTVELQTSLKIEAEAGVQDQMFHLSGAELSSQVTKRALVIDVDENNVISSINSTSTDQTSVIVGNLIKFAVTAASFGAGNQADEAQVVCVSDTEKYAAALSDLKAALAKTLSGMSTAKDPSNEQKKLDALAAAIVSVQTKLHRDVVLTIKPESLTATPTPLAFDDKAKQQLSELFKTQYFNPKNKTDDKGMNDDSLALFAIDASVVRAPESTDAINGEKPSSADPCSEQILLPAAAAIKITLNPKGKNFTKPTPVPLDMFASQLNSPQPLCISAGFGENRVIGLKFDKFGRTTELSWSSDARAANITSTLAGSAPDIASVASKLEGRDLAKQKTELDELSTENSLVLAKQCKAILDAGGTSCSK